MGLNVVPVGATVYNEVSENKDDVVSEEVKKEVEVLKVILQADQVIVDEPVDLAEATEAGPEVETTDAQNVEGADNE